MACFVVTAAEAVVVTAVAGVMAHREKKALAVPSVGNEGSKIANEHNEKIRFSKKLMWLANLLWGGAILLAFEHVWHGEVVPFFPFLTAAADPASAAEMLHEMATVGVTMSALVTLAWAGIMIVSKVIEKRAAKASSEAV